MLTNFYYKPTTRSVSDTISSFFEWIFAFCLTDQASRHGALAIIGIVIGYIIIIFAAVLYNELIILNVFGFAKNTKIEVIQRGEKEGKYENITELINGNTEEEKMIMMKKKKKNNNLLLKITQPFIYYKLIIQYFNNLI